MMEEKVTLMDIQQIKDDFRNVLKVVSVTSGSHVKYFHLLKKIYDKSPLDEFFEVFILFLQVVLVDDLKQENPFRERILQFLAEFTVAIKPTELEESIVESEFLEDLFYVLIEASDNENDNVRYHSCRMINRLLDLLIEEDMSLDLCEYIMERMLYRLQDHVVPVRLQAVAALHRLQDPTNDNDPIIAKYIDRMLRDPNSKVRAACVQNIVLRRSVVPHFLIKLRDVNVNVRMAAFKRASKLPNHFKIVERHIIIRTGFADISPSIKEFVESILIPEWLKYYNHDYLKLLNVLRIDADEKDISETLIVMDYVLNSLFKIRSHSELMDVLKFEGNLLKHESLNWETIVFWYYLVRYLRQNDNYENVLDQVLPELVEFCKYVEIFYKSKLNNNMTEVEEFEYQFILRFMFLILEGYDFSDVATRQCYINFVIKIFHEVHLSYDVIQVIINSLVNVMPSLEKRKTFVVGLISDILKPEDEINEKQNEIHLEIAKIKVQLNCVSESQMQAVANQDFIAAGKFQEELNTLIDNLKILEDQIKAVASVEHNIIKNDRAVLMKCLDMSYALLSSPTIVQLCPTLRTLKGMVFEELLSYPDEDISCKALKCYAVCCTIDKLTAELGIHVLAAHILAYHAQMPCHIETLLVAIRGVADILVIFGASLITSPEDIDESDSICEQDLCVLRGGTSLTSIIQGLVDLMDDERPEVQETASKGLCNLIVFGRVHSSHLISRMIIKWSKPILDSEIEEQRIRHTIGMMLEELPSIPDTADQLEQAVLLTVRIIHRAPKNSPLADVNLDNLIKFMVQLCKAYESDDVHCNLAIGILKNIKAKPNNKLNEKYMKILLRLDLVAVSASILNELMADIDELRDVVTNNKVLKGLIKFAGILHQNPNRVSDIKEINEDEEFID